jgi:hypothetical protein
MTPAAAETTAESLRAIRVPLDSEAVLGHPAGWGIPMIGTGEFS